jgi:hypothetical protein
MLNILNNSFMKTAAQVKQASLLVLLMGLGFFTGCSGIKTYPNNLDKNLYIATTTESGSFFSSVNATVDIYKVKPDCSLDYQGTIKLDKASVSVGIPYDQRSYLVFAFASSSFLANTSGSISYETLLKPRKDYHYMINASYIDGIYNVEIRETHPRKKSSRNIDTAGLSACK